MSQIIVLDTHIWIWFITQEFEQSLNTMYQQEGVETVSRGMGDTALWEYMGRAIASNNTL